MDLKEKNLIPLKLRSNLFIIIEKVNNKHFLLYEIIKDEILKKNMFLLFNNDESII